MKKYLKIIVAIVLIAGIGTGAYFLFFNNTTQDVTMSMENFREAYAKAYSILYDEEGEELDNEQLSQTLSAISALSQSEKIDALTELNIDEGFTSISESTLEDVELYKSTLIKVTKIFIDMFGDGIFVNQNFAELNKVYEIPGSNENPGCHAYATWENDFFTVSVTDLDLPQDSYFIPFAFEFKFSTLELDKGNFSISFRFWQTDKESYDSGNKIGVCDVAFDIDVVDSEVNKLSFVAFGFGQTRAVFVYDTESEKFYKAGEDMTNLAPAFSILVDGHFNMLPNSEIVRDGELDEYFKEVVGEKIYGIENWSEEFSRAKAVKIELEDWE